MLLGDKYGVNMCYVLADDLKVVFIMNEDELIEALKLYGNITLEEYFDLILHQHILMVFLLYIKYHQLSYS